MSFAAITYAGHGESNKTDNMHSIQIQLIIIAMMLTILISLVFSPKCLSVVERVLLRYLSVSLLVILDMSS